MATLKAIIAFIVAAKDRKGSSLPAIKGGVTAAPVRAALCYLSVTPPLQPLTARDSTARHQRGAQERRSQGSSLERGRAVQG